MERISSPDATPDRRFADGNPGTGAQGTVVNARWLNGVQEELVGLIEAAGVPPDGDENDQVRKAIFGLIYEVGDIYETTSDRTPAQRFGFGTWELFGVGRVTVCLDENDPAFNAVAGVGGEKTHVLTLDELTKHKHKYDDSYFAEGPPGSKLGSGNSDNNNDYSYRSPQPETEAAGEGKPFNILQPYIVVRRWRRIA